MRTFVFAGRNVKEILRDPLNISFGLGLPVLLLLVMSIIQKNVPVDIFNISSLAPGIAVFSMAFLTLFGASIIARDRETTFLTRLYTTPMRAMDFILGYALPLLPIALVQSLICYLVAFIFGLPVTVNILYALGASVPISIFFIALGLLFGSILNVKAVGGICGALVTNMAALLGGAWIDLSLMGEGMRTFAFCLPFANATELAKDIIYGTYDGTIWHFLIVLGYGVVTLGIAIGLFLRQMKKR